MFYHAPLAELPNRTASAGQYVLGPVALPVCRGLTREPSARYQLAQRVEETHPRPALRGFCRRRIGRGGRLFIDRCRPDYDFQGELTRVTLEQKEDLRHQQAKVQDFYATREVCVRMKSVPRHNMESNRSLRYRSDGSGKATGFVLLTRRAQPLCTAMLTIRPDGGRGEARRPRRRRIPMPSRECKGIACCARA